MTTDRLHQIREQKGMMLLELLFMVPLLSLLLMSIAAAFFLVLRLYFQDLSNMELEEQVRLATANLVTDIRYADKAEIIQNGIRIWTRRRSVGQRWFDYQIKNPIYSGKIMKDGQPLTGDCMYGDIRITKFYFEKRNERTIFFEIQAINKTTGKVFSLETGAFMQNQKSD